MFLKVFLLVCDLPLGFIFPTHPTGTYKDREGSVFAATAVQIQSNSEEANRFAPQGSKPDPHSLHATPQLVQTIADFSPILRSLELQITLRIIAPGPR